MNKFKLIILCALTLSFEVSAAPLVYCDNLFIKEIFIDAEREDDPTLNNKLFIAFKDSNGANVLCNGSDFIYLANDKPAYDGILSVVLTASTLQKKIAVFVNPSHTIGPGFTELAIIQLVSE